MPKIDIDQEVYDKLRERSERQGFDSVQDYVQKVLSALAEEEESEEEKVKSRLRQLGYLE